MALELTAKHERILDIFSGKTQYVIPAYQRSYSWGKEQCIELLEDLKQAFQEQEKNKNEGYFLGNIVTAESIKNPDILEVIDGQQRLTTLTLLIKVLFFFNSYSTDLENAIHIPSGDRRKEPIPRLKTNSFIEKDAFFLKEALSLDFGKDKACIIEKKDSQYKKNICYFYNEIKDMKKLSEDNFLDFIRFLLYDVTLLPIQTKDASPDSAREKALKIFETINNRGLSLADSDIFKAKLYAKALSEKQPEEFIRLWKELEENAKEINKPQGGNYSINDIFRFYTHIIRGKEGIVKSEMALREFFTQKDYSPLKKKDVSSEEILNNLFKIVKILEFFREVIENPKKYGKLSKWFQLIEQYSNQYPLNTLVVYLYVHDINTNNEQLRLFSKYLVRYAFYHGATTKIKFDFFPLISKIVKDREKNFILSYSEKNQRDLEYLGKLKKGFTLLAFYLNPKQEAIYPHYFNKIINSRDVKILNPTWSELELTYTDYSDTLGNMIIIDKNISRDVKLLKKEEYLIDSSIVEIKELANKLNNWSYQDYQNREISLKNRLVKFFEKTDDN